MRRRCQGVPGAPIRQDFSASPGFCNLPATRNLIHLGRAARRIRRAGRRDRRWCPAPSVVVGFRHLPRIDDRPHPGSAENRSQPRGRFRADAGVTMGPWFDASTSEREATIHEELNRLSGADRTAIVLCSLEGWSIERAARELRWPVGRLERRLSRALERLRLRMGRHYYGIPPGIWDSQIPRVPEAIVPERLIESTVAAATRQAGRGLTRRTANPGRTRLAPLTRRGPEIKAPAPHPSTRGETAENVGGATGES